jgi:hypothetical protein
MLLNGTNPLANKYYGGSYDGFSLSVSTEANLNGETPYAQKYFGGSYDGFSLAASTEANLNGETPYAQKYYGGSYDGFSLAASTEANLNGETPYTQKYFGGSYDGFSLSASTEANLNGETPYAQKYFGGSYDGFSLSASTEINLNGEAAMAAKFYGGSYDGFSMGVTGDLTLNGGSIALNKYYGGGNDGYAFSTMEETPLLVTLSSMSHVVSRNNVKLIWDVIQEYNNKGFYIERTVDGLNEWKKISFVNGRGNANSPMTYTFSDSKLKSGKYKYRIRQVDYSGFEFYYNLKNTVEIGTPDKFSLMQNYPNPFNPVTKIDFDIPVDENVSLKLYDITGRLVRTLIDEKLSAGYYTVEFFSGNLASGVYFYQLRTASFVTSRKMTVLK